MKTDHSGCTRISGDSNDGAPRTILSQNEGSPGEREGGREGGRDNEWGEERAQKM